MGGARIDTLGMLQLVLSMNSKRSEEANLPGRDCQFDALQDFFVVAPTEGTLYFVILHLWNRRGVILSWSLAAAVAFKAQISIH